MNRAEKLKQLAQLCLGGRDEVAPPAVEPSASPELDAALPGGGWQSGTLIELMSAETGIGELRLLMPALAQFTRSGRYIALISPPYIPFAPALSQHGVRLERLLIVQTQKPADTLWAFEQTLRCKSFGAVLAWPARIKDRELRRLQLAAEAGNSIGFLYRSPAAAHASSPAATRLRLQARLNGGVDVEILKCRGGRSGITVHCALHKGAPIANNAAASAELPGVGNAAASPSAICQLLAAAS
jgi:cell division inhibitor SulA/protein ImuA